MQPATLNHLIMILVSANMVFLTAVTCALIAVTGGAFLQPDPFQVVVTVLEEFASNQTHQLAKHLGEVHTVLEQHSAVLAQLTSFLASEETRGERLCACL